MLEPKYDEDTVNLGYLKKIISDTEENIDDTYKNVSRHYASRPQPPYYKGDTWIDGDIVYTCINTRTIGLYQDTDWVTESGAKTEAERKNKTYLTQPSNYSAGDMWILQSDNDHRAGKKGEILISTAGRKIYDADDWVNMLGYGTISSINEVAGNLNNAINRIGNVEEAIEDGIIITFYQETVPEGVHIGDLWYVTGELEGYTKGKIYRYDGTNWIKLDDPAIQEAFDEANEARLVADGKIQSFYSETKPTKDMGVGDLWIDIAHNNELYRYNGTNWVAVYDTRINDLVVDVETVTERVATIETDLGEIDLKVQENTTTITTIGSNIDNVEKEITNIVKTQGTATGKNIHLEDSSDEQLVSIKIKGETNQATRSGKNKCKITISSQTKNGLDVVVNADKTILINGTATANTLILLSEEFNIPSGTYCLSGCPQGGSSSTYKLYLNGVSGQDLGEGKIITLSTEENTCAVINISKGVVCNNLLFKPQLEIGSTATDYEAPGASPSPDYRSPIENVEGKNKFNKKTDYFQLYMSTTSIVQSENDYIGYIKCKPNTCYSISKAITYAQGFYVGCTEVLPSHGVNIINGIQSSSATKCENYKTPSNAKYLVFRIGPEGNGITLNEMLDNIQVEEGQQATPYVPHNSLEIKDVGENLLNVTAKTTTVQGLTFTVNEDKSITINGTNTGNTGTGTAFFRLADNFVLPAGDYTLSNKNANASGNSFIFYDDSYNFVTKNISNATFTKDTTIKPYIRVKAGATVNNQTIYPMILKGAYTEETMPAYKPYQEQKETFPLGNQKLMKGSYLVSGGIQHNRKQVILGDITSLNSGTVLGVECQFAIYTFPDAKNTGRNYNFVSDRISPANEIFGQYKGYRNAKQLLVLTTADDTVENFNSKISGSILEYELSEPETVPYTAEQQEAYDKIEQLHTYKNVTNIFSDAELDIVYARDNGLSDMYETKQNAERNYTKTTEKLVEQKMTTDNIQQNVSKTETIVANNYKELKTKFDDYAPKSDVVTLQNSVEKIQTDTYTKTEINTKLIDGSVEKVSTTAGTFDENGLTIEKTNAKTKGNFNEKGMSVIDNTGSKGETLLFAGYDEELNETIVKSKNMTVEKYLVVGANSRFENYNNTTLNATGTGVFII